MELTKRAKLKTIKGSIKSWLFVFLYSLPILIGLAIGALWIIALIKYGSTPISEVPAWAYIFFRGGR